MILFSRWRIYWFHERPEPSDEWTDPSFMLPGPWLRAFRDKSVLLPALRRLLIEDGVELSRVSDDAILKLVARKIEVGQIGVLQRKWRDESQMPQGDGDKPAAFPKAERTPPKASSAPPVNEDVFPRDADLAAIADVLKNASKLGTPFCEECAKAAAAAAAEQKT